MKRERGLLPLGPVVYLVAGIAILGILSGIAYKIRESGKDAVRVEWAEANQQEKERQAREAAVRSDITDKNEATNATKVAILEDRLRRALLIASGVRQPDAKLGEAAALSAAAAILACPDRQADAARRLGQLEVGVLALLDRGNKAILRSETCRAWLSEQMMVDVK